MAEVERRMRLSTYALCSGALMSTKGYEFYA